jgi:ApaG protein
VENGFHATTEGIGVDVNVFYLENQSEPQLGRFVWAYRVRISNATAETVQLLSRTWRITDAHGQVTLVEGEGVVGAQPVLKPGESFEYTSGTPLGTPSGFMTGTYHMVRAENGEPFDVAIPNFSLDSPYQNGRIH